MPPSQNRITMLLTMLRTAVDALCAELAPEGEVPPPSVLQHVPPPPAALPAAGPNPQVSPMSVGQPLVGPMQVGPAPTSAYPPPVGPLPMTVPGTVLSAPVGPPPVPLARPVPPPPTEARPPPVGPPPTEARPPQRRRPLPAPPVGAEQTGLGLSRLPRELKHVISRSATSVLRSHRGRESPLHLASDSSAAFMDVAAYVLSRPAVAAAAPVLTEVDVWLVLRTSHKRGVGPRFHFSVGAGEPADFAARAIARVKATHRPAAPSHGGEGSASDDDYSDSYPTADASAQGWSPAASSATAERHVRPRRA